MGKDLDLMQAVRDQDAPAVEKILTKHRSSKKLIGSTKRLNINQQDVDGMSALHHAALLDNVEILQALLDHGAQVNIKDAKGMQPLHYAAWQGKERPVELLLQHGSSVNETAFDGNTALHLACEHGHFEVVDALLRYGADPTLPNNQHKTPLDHACEFGRTPVVKYLLQMEQCCRLLQDTSDDMTANDRTTCLHLAARNGHIHIIRLLLEAGIDVNRQTLQGTCLHEAAKYGKTEVVRLLLSCGIDVSRLNSYEQTALEIVNKFTATRAAKELKQMLKDASSTGTHVPTVRDFSCASDLGHVTFKDGEILTVMEQNVNSGMWKGYRNELESHAARVGYFPTCAVTVVDANSHRAVHQHSKPFHRNRSSPQPVSPIDSAHSRGAVTIDNGFSSPSSPIVKVKGSSHDSNSNGGILSHLMVNGQRSNGQQKGNAFSSGDRQSPGLLGSSQSGWNSHHPGSDEGGLHKDATTTSSTGSHRTSSGSSGSGGGGCQVIGGSQPTNSRQNRLSGQSCESGVSGVSSSRQSYHSSTSSSSQGSLDHLEESGYSSTVNVHELLQQGLSDVDILHTWLSSLHLEELTHLFVDAGYDMATISRMTPEDLTAIGITKPAIRKKLKAELSKLSISDGIPDCRPRDMAQWLNTLHLDGYHDILVQQGYRDLDSITNITWEDLEEIGIKKLGHQKKIMLAIDRLKRINSTLHQLSAPSNSHSSAEVLNNSESFGFPGKSSSGSSDPPASTFVSLPPQHHPSSYEISSSKSWKMTPRDIGFSTNEVQVYTNSQNERAGLIEIHPSPAPSNRPLAHIAALSCTAYALPDGSTKTEVGYQTVVGQTYDDACHPLLGKTIESDGDTTPTNERKNTSTLLSSDRNQKHKIISKLRGNSREEPIDVFNLEQNNIRDNGFLSYSTLPRKVTGKRKMAGFDDSFEPVGSSHYGNDLCIQSKEAGQNPNSGFSMGHTDTMLLNRHRKEPPPPPKRTNSFKTDAHSVFGIAGDRLRLEAGVPPFSGSPFMNSIAKTPKDFDKAPSNVDANLVMSGDNYAQDGCHKRLATGRAPEDIAGRLQADSSSSSAKLGDWQDGRTGDSSDDSDSGLESRHSASSASLESSGSGGAVESNTLPFANENVGTIKQRNSTSKPSILSSSSTGDTNELNASLFDNGNATMKPNHSRPSSTTYRVENNGDTAAATHFVLVNGEIVEGSPVDNRNLPFCGSSDVFNDIDGMLMGLTQELDEMLKLHG